MAAQYAVTFEDGRGEYVFSADAKSFKRADLRAALVKARKKAEAKHAKRGFPRSRVTSVRCVG